MHPCNWQFFVFQKDNAPCSRSSLDCASVVCKHIGSHLATTGSDVTDWAVQKSMHIWPCIRPRACRSIFHEAAVFKRFIMWLLCQLCCIIMDFVIKENLQCIASLFQKCL